VVAYDGFEPSGRMHIAQARAVVWSLCPFPSQRCLFTCLQGVMKALNVNKLTKCGVTFKFWVADWFALMNNKLGGDLGKIQTCGRYMTEVWRAVGMDMTRVQFLSSSEEINARAGEYWPLVLDIARRNNLQRIVRCSQIMGRADTDDLAGACVPPLLTRSALPQV
jgi:tyrosyl-tRNA synthetase